MSSNPFSNIFNTKEENKSKNSFLFNPSPLFNSNSDNKGASGTNFNLFSSNVGTNNLFLKNPINEGNNNTENNEKNKKEGTSLFGESNTMPLFGNNNNNPTNPSNNFSLFGNNDKKKETSTFGFFINNKDNEKDKNLNISDNQKGGLFGFQNNILSDNKNDNNSDNNKNQKGFLFNINNNNNGKLFTNNNEEETPMTNDKNKENKNSIFEPNNNTNFNPFMNTNVPKKEISTQKEVKKFFDFGDNSSTILNNNSNNNALFSNQKEIIIESNEINNNIQNIQEENEEMEIDEEIKQDSDSTNSDAINNLWISDNKEIIDDDTDINKKIDYKKLEEESKNKDNNINDINLLILPELSEYYFSKSKSFSDYYTFSDSNIKDKFSIEISRKIIEILSNLIKRKNLDENKEAELINIATIYIYFDAFILHRNDVIYLMKLRDELLYKYYIPNETLINFDKKNNLIYNNEYNNINSLIILLKKIYFHLTLLDINKAYQQI